MKKWILTIGCFACILLVFLFVLHDSQEDETLVLEDNVQNYLLLQGYENCYLMKFANLDKLEEKEVILEITKEEIDSCIASELSENYYRERITSRNWIEKDDLALADYKILDGKKEVDSVEKAPIRVGSGYYDIFLENALLGLEIGKEHTINWSVPEDFENTEWAGKKLDIVITVTELYKVITPTKEEYAIQQGFETVNEYEENVRNDLLEVKKDTLIEQTTEDIIDKLIEKSELKITDKLVVDNAIKYYSSYKELASVCGVSVEEYVGISGETNADIYDICYGDSLREIQRYFVIGRYAEENSITIIEDDITEYCEERNIPSQELNEEDLIHVKYSIIEEKVLKHICETYVVLR